MVSSTRQFSVSDRVGGGRGDERVEEEWMNLLWRGRGRRANRFRASFFSSFALLPEEAERKQVNRKEHQRMV